MMRNQYIDRIHPAVCFGYFIAAIATGMVLRHPVYLGLNLLGVFLLNISIHGAGVVKKLLLFLPISLIVAAINPLFNTLGNTVLFTVFGRPYTLEALLYGGVTGGMLLGMLLWFSAYNAVLTDDKFSYLFGTLSPSFSLLLTTVFRMIPNLAGKIRQIRAARRCIGKAGGDSAKEKLDSGMTAISILTSWALEGGVTTADSMNSRGYGTAKRSCFHSYRFGASDILLCILLTVTWLSAVVLLLTGGADTEWFPAIRLAAPDPFALTAYLIFLLTPTILNWNEELKWHILRSKI